MATGMTKQQALYANIVSDLEDLENQIYEDGELDDLSKEDLEYIEDRVSNLMWTAYVVEEPL